MDICNRLVRFDVDLVPEEVRPYIRDVYDHSVRINETVDTLRELLTSALEANLSLIAVTQNDSMKQLAGLGRHHRGAHHDRGSLRDELPSTCPSSTGGSAIRSSIGLMVTVCGGLYWRFKRAGWL